MATSPIRAFCQLTVTEQRENSIVFAIQLSGQRYTRSDCQSVTKGARVLLNAVYFPSRMPDEMRSKPV